MDPLCSELGFCNRMWTELKLLIARLYFMSSGTQMVDPVARASRASRTNRHTGILVPDLDLPCTQVGLQCKGETQEAACESHSYWLTAGILDPAS